MAATGEFRRAMFGGFNEDDVIEYIKQLSREKKTSDELYQKTISELEIEVNQKKETLEELNKNIEELNSSTAELKKEKKASDETVNYLRKKIENLQNDLAERDKTIEEKDVIIMGVNSKIHKLNHENSKLESKLDYYEESKHKYEMFNTRFGSIVTQAHTQAERIIDDAMSEYEDISGSSVKAVEYFSDHFIKLRSEVDGFMVAMNEVTKFESLMHSTVGKIDERLELLSKGMAEALGVLEENKNKSEETGRSVKNDTNALKIDLTVLDELLKEEAPNYEEEEFLLQQK